MVQLKIGWAVKDITPYGKTVSLYGQGNMRVTSDIRDPLQVTALAIEGDGGQMILVSCDLTEIPDQLLASVRLALHDLAGFNPAHLIINATHVHTAPYLEWHHPSELWGELFDYSDQFVAGIMTPDEFLADVHTGIVSAARAAWMSRIPGGVSFELAYPATGSSRRIIYHDGTCRMYGPSDCENFAGLEEASDPGAELLYTFDLEGKLTGIVANVACPAQVIELSMAISADYLSETRRIVQADHPVPILLQIAPAGDQSPRDMIRMKWQKSGPFFPRDASNDAHLKVIGERLALAILSRLEAAAAAIEWSPVLANANRLLELPLYQVSREEYEASLPIAETIEANYQANGNHFRPGESPTYLFNRGVVLRYQYQQQTTVVPIEITALRIGSAAFISNPFELYTVYGLQIKAINPASQTFAVQLANGSCGYLPSARAVASGSYGCLPSSCWVGPEGGEMLVCESINLLRELFKA